MPNRRKRQALWLRRTRRVHRLTGVALFLFFFVIGITSLLLGWKKNVEWIMPPTSRGTELPLEDWLNAGELAAIAQTAVVEGLGPDYDPTVDRLDYRPDKGSLKVLFKNHYGEVQLNGATGEVLSIGIRRSDFIEHLHDGSVLGDPFKLFYTTVMGLAVIVFTVSGFWLWYGPKRMRRG